MPAGVRIEHELRQCPVQPGHPATHDGKARARELRARGRIEPQWLTHVEMVLHGEVVRGRRAPAAHLHVVGLAPAHRYGFVRQVGQRGQQRIEFGLHGLQLGRDTRLLGRHGSHLGHQRRGVLALPPGLADLLRQRIALGLKGFRPGLQRLAARLQRLEGCSVEGETTGLETAFYLCGVPAQCLNIDHPAILVVCRRNRARREAPDRQSRIIHDKGTGTPAARRLCRRRALPRHA